MTVGKHSPQLEVELHRFGVQISHFNAVGIHTNVTNVAQTVLIVQIFCAAGWNVRSSVSVVRVTAERAGCSYFCQILKICCCQI